jgi:mRNA interferase RelE/StbE
VGSYSLSIKASAAKEIERIEPKSFRQKVVKRIRELARDPRPPGCEKLVGSAERYRVRQGVWRIVYEVLDKVLVVVVVKVGHRRDIYKNL